MTTYANPSHDLFTRSLTDRLTCLLNAQLALAPALAPALARSLTHSLTHSLTRLLNIYFLVAGRTQKKLHSEEVGMLQYGGYNQLVNIASPLSGYGSSKKDTAQCICTLC